MYLNVKKISFNGIITLFLIHSGKLLPNLDKAKSDEFTAKDNSSGNSGGTTEVNIKVHSKNSRYLFLFGSSVPVNK